MKIYTRTGDDGSTGLIGGRRVQKDDATVEACGALDELNAAIGLVRTVSGGWPLDLLLGRVQGLIFEVGAELASEEGRPQACTAALGSIDEDLERSIDIQEAMLPKLTRFILPGGSEIGARLHFARTVCRAAERRTVALAKEKPVRSEILTFLNRLSDWMFVAARTANHEADRPEPVWTKED